jgi:hypothetical protein
MTFAKKTLALAFVAVAAAALTVSAQTAELNPTVKVLPKPQSPVPADCATDNSLEAMPALEPQPAPEQVMATVPPSNDLRARLRRLQVAAEGDDYAAFKAAYADARRGVAAHPAGGERNAANEALQVFADIARVWDYAMASPTGSFFDSTIQGGSLINALKRYPDFGRALADETYTAGGRTLYPTRETRRFLARESSRRLTRLGVSTPTRMAQGAPPEHRTAVVPPAVKKPVQTATKTTPKPKATTKTARSEVAPKPHATKHKPAVKTAEVVTPKSKTPRIESTPVPKAKPVPPPVKIAATTTTVAPVPPPVVTTTTTAAPPPVVTTTTATDTVTTAVPATNTTASASTTSSTDTTATAAPDTATTGTAVPAGKQNGNMNLILAVVLILVSIGVLIILLRASD